MAKAIHTMLRVLDETRALDFYRTAFGLQIADRFEFESFVLVYLRNPQADFELELTVNKGTTEPYALGNGYGHLAFAVGDLEGEHARIKAAGYAPNDIVDFAPGGTPLARFFFVSDPDGYKIEVLQRQGRYQ